MYKEWQRIYNSLNRRNRLSMALLIRLRLYRFLVWLVIGYDLIYWAYIHFLGLGKQSASMQLFAVRGAALSTVVIVWAIYRVLIEKYWRA